MSNTITLSPIDNIYTHNNRVGEVNLIEKTCKKIKLIKKRSCDDIVYQKKEPDTAVASTVTSNTSAATTTEAVTTPIHNNSRCIAICADNTQCTRVKKRGCLLCGTHAKSGVTNTKNMTAIDVWVEEINGIVYYLDKNGNVYDTEGVLENRFNPVIIGHYSKNMQNISIEFI